MHTAENIHQPKRKYSTHRVSREARVATGVLFLILGGPLRLAGGVVLSLGFVHLYRSSGGRAVRSEPRQNIHYYVNGFQVI